jgi:hypothetical protein
MIDLREHGIVTKLRTLKTGRTIGGTPFSRGPLAHFLRNRLCIGEVVFKDEVFPGEQFVRCPVISLPCCGGPFAPCCRTAKFPNVRA